MIEIAHILTGLIHGLSLYMGLKIYRGYESSFINCGKKYLGLMSIILTNIITIIYILPHSYNAQNLQSEIVMLSFFIGLACITASFIGTQILKRGNHDRKVSG